MIDKNITSAVIACGSLEPELKHIGRDTPGTALIFMDQILHRTPEKITALLQDRIDEIATYDHIQRIVLGYGLCSNGTVGIKAPRQGLYLPAVHDCIAMYIGSHKQYAHYFNQHPGTYYLTKSWIELKKDPLGLMENEYSERVGKEDAEWTIKEEMKHYSCIAFINTQVNNADIYRKRTRENADFFNKKYLEIEGSSSFFKKMINGPYDTKDFIYIEPGNIVKQKLFFNKTGGLL